MDHPIEETKHSPLGASSSERWLNCPGSVALLKHLDIPEETDEPSYRSEGTSAHAAAAHCLQKGLECFEVIGQTFGKHKVDQEMYEGIEMYVTECLAGVEAGDEVLIETGIAAPEFHPDFFGTVDHSVIKFLKKILRVRDLKFGKGITVDVEDNTQEMYYAYGIVRKLLARGIDLSDWVVDLGIVQPRGFHPDGPIRTWQIPVAQLIHWAETVLKPGMIATALESDLCPGDHCRFCPAKLVCPMLESLFGAAMLADPKKVIKLTISSLALNYEKVKPVEMYVKALKAEMLRRLLAGEKDDNVKLVFQKGNRTWKSDAELIIKTAYGQDAYTAPELKSPAVIDNMEGGKAITKQYAYTPETDLTVALADDKRTAQSPPKPETFADYVKPGDKI